MANLPRDDLALRAHPVARNLDNNMADGFFHILSELTGRFSNVM